MPKGKKKGSKKKLKNMTDEERVLYMEQKMLLEAEAKKKKEDLLNELLKEKLAKEEKYAKKNLNTINYQWRSIMRDAKAKELLKDIEIMSQTFERIIDRKDSVIKSLVKDLSEAEEQYAMAMRSHVENVDNLVDLQREQLDTLKGKYEGEVVVVKEEFDREREYIDQRHEHEMNELTMIIYAMEKTFLDQETEANHKYQMLKDEIKTKHGDEKSETRVKYEGILNGLWKQFLQAMKNYREITDDRSRQFEDLKAKDAASAKEIDSQMRKIQILTENIMKQKAKIAMVAQEAQEVNNSIKENRDIMSKHFHDLKAQMKIMQDNMRKKLTKLTVETDAALKMLTEKDEKARQILRFAEMCRKLETEEEKILPFYASSLTEKEEQDIKQALLENPAQEIAEVMKDYLSLENFWKRYNKVLLDKASLDKEKQVLMTENAQLRILLKQYLDGISVSDEVLTNANPLLVVNNRTNVRLNVPVGSHMVDRGAKVIIEGTQHIAHTI